LQTPKPEGKISTYRKWRKRILVSLLVIVLVPTVLFSIGWLNRDTVIEVIQDWYDDHNSGELTIGKIDASFISAFPNVGFTLKEITQTNRDTVADKYSRIKIKEATLVIGAGNLLRGNIKFKKVIISDAIMTSEVISEKALAFHEQLQRDKALKERAGIQMPEWLHDDGVTFQLNNVKYITKDSILNKYFNLDIHEIKGYYKGDNLQLDGNLNMDITINNLGFNTKKGSYFNGARVSANPDFTIDLEHDNISLPEFVFKIDKQPFNLSADFILQDSSQYQFKLQNSETDFNTLKELLPDNIASKIEKFNIQNPIETDLNLSGKFAYGNSPEIEVDFSTTDNTIIVGKNIQLKNATFQGHLTNDVYKTDSLKRIKKSSKDLKIVFNELKANLDDITLNINDAYYQSTPEALNFIEAQLNLEGTNEALAQLIETENFDFKGGTFQFDAAISGDIPNAYEFVNQSTGKFNLKNTRVILKKNGLQLPIKTIDLILERENSTLNRLVVNLPDGDNLVLTGHLKNSASLLAKDPKTATTSSIALNSKQLNINNIISLAKQFIPKSTRISDDRKNLHETLDAVYSQFQPRFNINVNALTYNDVTIKDLKSSIDLVNAKTIVLRYFDFNYFDALTNVKGSVIIPEPESSLRDAIYIDAETTSHGAITIFKKLFNISLFRLDSGKYEFNGKVKGNVKRFSELLNTANGNLTLSKTKLFYEPAKMDITIDSLALLVENSNMLLNKLDIEIGELYPIKINGNIKQFPSFLLDDRKDSGSVFLKIFAPFIDGNTIVSEIDLLKNDDTSKTLKDKKALYQLFKDINTFNPEIELTIDSLKYKDLITENVNASLSFKNDSILKLNALDFKYKQTKAKIYGEINAHGSQLDALSNNPFDLDFDIAIKGKSEDLNAYLKTKNFIFTSGDFEFMGEYKAQADNLSIINANGLGDLKISNTLVDYEAAGLKIPVDSMHVKIANDVAEIKTLDIDLPGKSEVFFSGSINRFSDFINDLQNDEVRNSDFAIYAPYLDAVDILQFLASASSGRVDETKTKLNLNKFKEALVGINTSFYPTATIKIDTLKSDNLTITDFGTNLLFNTNNNFKIEDTHLNFYGGTLEVDIAINTNNVTDIPVDISLQANAIDLHELVTRFNYFGDDNLRHADKVEGTININMKTSGTLNNDSSLNMNSLNGTLSINVSDLALYNFKPIMENSVMMKDDRFKELQFRPIIQTFKIVDGELIIPRTEIQTSALHLFAEGRLKFNDYVNIWLALPWKNLKSNDGLTLPEKTTYDDAGSKFYVQLLKDKNSKNKKKKDLKVKFRLSNRKLRKLRQEQN